MKSGADNMFERIKPWLSKERGAKGPAQCTFESGKISEQAVMPAHQQKHCAMDCIVYNKFTWR